MPNRQEERDQQWDHQEWEPSGALRSVLEDTPLSPGMDRNGDLARLKPQLKEALSTLKRLERQRDLSEREKTRAGALALLLSSIERVGW